MQGTGTKEVSDGQIATEVGCDNLRVVSVPHSHSSR